MKESAALAQAAMKKAASVNRCGLWLLPVLCVWLGGCSVVSWIWSDNQPEFLNIFQLVDTKGVGSSFDTNAAFALGEGLILATSSDGKFGVMDSAKGGFFGSLRELKSGFSVLAVDKERRFVAIGGVGLLVVYNLSDFSPYKILRKIRAAPRVADFSPDGKELLVGAADGRVYRWTFDKPGRVQRGRRITLESYIGHPSIVTAVRYHPSGRIFFSSDASGTLFGWLTYDADPHEGYYDQNLFGNRFFANEPTRLRGGVAQGEAISHIVVSMDGRWLVTATVTGMANVWAVQGFKSATEVSLHSGLVYDLEYSIDGRTLVSLGRDGFFRAWSIESDGISAQTLEPAYELSMLSEQQLSDARAIAPLTREKVAVIFRKGKLTSLSLPRDDQA